MAVTVETYYQAARSMDDRAGAGLQWIQECLDASEGMGRWLANDALGQDLADGWFREDQGLHIPLNSYLLAGEDHSLLFDTLSRSRPQHVVDEVTGILGDAGLDYVVPSHDEAPHAGNADILGRELGAQLIECGAAGATPELHDLVYEQADPIEVTHGDTIDLGGYVVEFVEPVLLDSAMTTWLFEHETETLFTVDSFGFPHHADECRRFADELATPVTANRTLQYTGRSLQWLQFADAGKVKADLDALTSEFDPANIAPAHGQVVRDVDFAAFVEMIKTNVDWITEHGTLEVDFSL